MTATLLEARLAKAGLRRSRAEQERHAATQGLAVAVRAAAKAGMTKTHIAYVAGISRQTVHEILRD
jgi:DNA-binding XRE family transcriptional regulator